MYTYIYQHGILIQRLWYEDDEDSKMHFDKISMDRKLIAVDEIQNLALAFHVNKQ